MCARASGLEHRPWGWSFCWAIGCASALLGSYGAITRGTGHSYESIYKAKRISSESPYGLSDHAALIDLGVGVPGGSYSRMARRRNRGRAGARA
jgi:hypothetical protein